MKITKAARNQPPTEPPMSSRPRKIETVEFHAAALAAAKAVSAARAEDDASENGMSTWADSIEERFHGAALRALANGPKIGARAAMPTQALIDTSGAVVSTTIETRRVGFRSTDYWILNPDAAKRLGRRDIPTGERSRVQGILGLREVEDQLVPVDALIFECSFIGHCGAWSPAA